jgi:hypothetical protein
LKPLENDIILRDPWISLQVYLVLRVKLGMRGLTALAELRMGMAISMFVPVFQDNSDIFGVLGGAAQRSAGFEALAEQFGLCWPEYYLSYERINRS